MSVQRRLAALERRFPAEPQRPAPEFVPLPPLAEFGAMPPGRQTHVLLGWEPVLDPAVTLPWPENLDAMTEDEWRRLSDALGRVGREILAPYVECLPLDQRVALARGDANAAGEPDLAGPGLPLRLPGAVAAWPGGGAGRPASNDRARREAAMTLKGRVARLERGGRGSPCTCRIEGVVVVHPGEPDPPPPRSTDGSCLACGGRLPDPYPRVIIHMPTDDGAAPEGDDRWARSIA